MTGADSTGTDPTVGARRASPKVAADRVALPVGVLVGDIVATAASVGIAARLVPADGRDPSWAMLGGAVSGALAVGAMAAGALEQIERLGRGLRRLGGCRDRQRGRNRQGQAEPAAGHPQAVPSTIATVQW